MTEQTPEQTPPQDLVASTFKNLRATAKRRGGTLPNLNRQGAGVIPRRSTGKGNTAPELSLIHI